MSGPSEQLLSWSADVIGSDAVVRSVTGLHRGSNPWLLRIQHAGIDHEAVLRMADNRRWPFMLEREAAALKFAEKHQLPAPRLIAADLDGHHTGVAALLQSVMPGTSRIQVDASAERLHSWGKAAAMLHSVELMPGPDGPLRTHPIPPDDHALERRWAARYMDAPQTEKETVLQELYEATGWPTDSARGLATHQSVTPAAIRR